MKGLGQKLLYFTCNEKFKLSLYFLYTTLKISLSFIETTTFTKPHLNQKYLFIEWQGMFNNIHITI